MTEFEQWQVGIGIAQSVVLLFTFVAALWIGWTQNQINKSLLDLNYFPSIEVNFDNQRINILNRGKTDILLWGTKFADETKEIGNEPRYIAPG